MPYSYFTDLKIDNAEEIKKIQQPFLWLHGTADAFLKIEHGELVAKNYSGTFKSENRITGAAHSNVPGIMGIGSYMLTLENFIAR